MLAAWGASECYRIGVKVTIKHPLVAKSVNRRKASSAFAPLEKETRRFEAGSVLILQPSPKADVVYFVPDGEQVIFWCSPEEWGPAVGL